MSLGLDAYGGFSRGAADKWAADRGLPLSKRLMHVGARSQLPTGTIIGYA